ncbi:MAG: hypothetical protein OXG15_11240 [Gammaproteobacteria bacterium]|nr:hypothetical protein [Gammaproteobacteria bacterium]
MTGLSVLYAKEAKKEGDWQNIPERNKTARLREVYWMRRVNIRSTKKQFVRASLDYLPERSELARNPDDPGDGFVYFVHVTPTIDDQFEWIEVTEVFTTVHAKEIERAMRAWNGIPNSDPIEFDVFLKNLRFSRPSRTEQRRAADRVIAQVESKLLKKSYLELAEKYGYGTLVVGMPLWFATLPIDPLRAENAIDDFISRTKLGLVDVRQRLLRRRNCPFKRVIVVWDTTPEAINSWYQKRATVYNQPAFLSLSNPLVDQAWIVLAKFLGRVGVDSKIPESEWPSLMLYLEEEHQKKSTADGPYPIQITELRNFVHNQKRSSLGMLQKFKIRMASLAIQLLCFLKIFGGKNLVRLIWSRFSISGVFRAQRQILKQQHFYHESRRRTQDIHEAN